MIDPHKITNYNRSPSELEEFATFCVLVAGKTAATTSRLLGRFLSETDLSSFQYILSLGEAQLAGKLHHTGIGCYKGKAKTLTALASANLNLKNCSSGDLEEIWGIGYKTSRFFLVHSREGIYDFVPDRHVLTFLRAAGTLNVPGSTPSSLAEQQRLKQAFLALAQRYNTSPANLDQLVWSYYSKKSIEDFERYVARSRTKVTTRIPFIV